MRGADLILHGGDVSAASVLDDLRRLGPPLEVVHGNADEPALKAVLPRERVVEAAEMRIGLVHNAGPRAGREARLAARFPDCAAVLYGHTHVPQAEQFQHLWILNPGSPTERRTAAARSMLILTLHGRRLTPELITLP